MKPRLKTWQKLVFLRIIYSITEKLDLSVMDIGYKQNEKSTCYKQKNDIFVCSYLVTMSRCRRVYITLSSHTL